ncbi:hypothetical protein ANN_05070 [Periplaneta americana]|uniref:Uncharacterized protein n=1 Tax=Periplaneta americana TaxID=6978 RepID=A0ABQ8TC73_PERAM|nr:hypothetical protein ANN_05070 [Periplaneta americana]
MRRFRKTKALPIRSCARARFRFPLGLIIWLGFSEIFPTRFNSANHNALKFEWSSSTVHGCKFHLEVGAEKSRNSSSLKDALVTTKKSTVRVNGFDSRSGRVPWVKFFRDFPLTPSQYFSIAAIFYYFINLLFPEYEFYQQSKNINSSCRKMMPGLIAVYLLFGAVLLAGTTQESSSWHKLFSRLRKRDYIHLDDASRLRRTGTSFIPNINEIDPNATFIEDVEGYPHELLLEILKKEGAIHNDIFGVESEFETKRVFPKAALSKDGQWKYVVNTKEDYIQGVDVEICGFFDSRLDDKSFSTE